MTPHQFASERHTEHVCLVFGLPRQKAQLLQMLIGSDLAHADELSGLLGNRYVSLRLLRMTLKSHHARLINRYGIGYYIPAVDKVKLLEFFENELAWQHAGFSLEGEHGGESDQEKVA